MGSSAPHSRTCRCSSAHSCPVHKIRGTLLNVVLVFFRNAYRDWLLVFSRLAVTNVNLKYKGADGKCIVVIVLPVRPHP